MFTLSPPPATADVWQPQLLSASFSFLAFIECIDKLDWTWRRAGSQAWVTRGNPFAHPGPRPSHCPSLQQLSEAEGKFQPKDSDERRASDISRHKRPVWLSGLQWHRARSFPRQVQSSNPNLKLSSAREPSLLFGSWFQQTGILAGTCALFLAWTRPPAPSKQLGLIFSAMHSTGVNEIFENRELSPHCSPPPLLPAYTSAVAELNFTLSRVRTRMMKSCLGPQYALSPTSLRRLS